MSQKYHGSVGRYRGNQIFGAQVEGGVLERSRHFPSGKELVEPWRCLKMVRKAILECMPEDLFFLDEAAG